MNFDKTDVKRYEGLGWAPVVTKTQTQNVQAKHYEGLGWVPVITKR